MGIKLWVDDLRKAPKGWHCARTVTEAVRALATMDVEAISLDHDITHTKQHGNVMVPIYDEHMAPVHCSETFEPVARYIAERKKAEPAWNVTIRLHTANGEAAHKMDAILEGTGVSIEIRMADDKDYENE